MDPDENGGNPYRINRREALKRAAIVTGAAWAAPVLTSLRTPAFAQYGAPCEENCIYIAVITNRNGTLTCSECEPAGPCSSVCFGRTCAGSACSRVTSMTDEGIRVTVCHDCELDPSFGGACYTCQDTGGCDCTVGIAIDGNCMHLGRHFATCTGDEQWYYAFRCQAC